MTRQSRVSSTRRLSRERLRPLPRPLALERLVAAQLLDLPRRQVLLDARADHRAQLVRLGIASTSTLSPSKPALRLSVFFVGRVGRSQRSTCSRVMAIRSNAISAFGAASLRPASTLREMSIPLGSRSPR